MDGRQRRFDVNRRCQVLRSPQFAVKPLADTRRARRLHPTFSAQASMAVSATPREPLHEATHPRLQHDQHVRRVSTPPAMCLRCSPMRTARARRPRRCTAPAIRASWHTPALNSSCKKSCARWGTDIPLPSVGAEGDMVRRIADLAGTGHHGVLIRMADKDAPRTRGGGHCARRRRCGVLLPHLHH